MTDRDLLHGGEFHTSKVYGQHVTTICHGASNMYFSTIQQSCTADMYTHTPYILGPHAPHMQDTQFSGTSLKVDKSPADISTVMLQCLLQGEDSK